MQNAGFENISRSTLAAVDSTADKGTNVAERYTEFISLRGLLKITRRSRRETGTQQERTARRIAAEARLPLRNAEWFAGVGIDDQSAEWNPPALDYGGIDSEDSGSRMENSRRK